MKKLLLCCLPLYIMTYAPWGQAAEPSAGQNATVQLPAVSLRIPQEARVPAGQTWNDLLQQAHHLKQFGESTLKQLSPAQADQLYEDYGRVIEKLQHDFNNVDIHFLHDHFSYYDYNEKTETYTPKPEIIARQQQLAAVGFEYQDAGEGMAVIKPQADYYPTIFMPYLSPAYRDYAFIYAAQAKEQAVMDGGLLIGFQELGGRIAAWEGYLRTYPDSKWKQEVQCRIAAYQTIFLTGLDNSPLFEENNKLSPDVAQTWQDFVLRYPDSPTTGYIKQIQAQRGKSKMLATAVKLLQAQDNALCEKLNYE